MFAMRKSAMLLQEVYESIAKSQAKLDMTVLPVADGRYFGPVCALI